MKIEYTDYSIFVVSPEEYNRISGKLGNSLVIKADLTMIPSKEYLKATAYHFLSLRNRSRWIRDEVYLFLALLLRETQIHRIKKRMENLPNPVYVVIAEDRAVERLNINEVELKTGLEQVDELAYFRLLIEKERVSP